MMSAAVIELLSAPSHSQLEGDHQRMVRDLAIVTLARELAAECGDLTADLCHLVEAAHQRLLNCSERANSSAVH